MKPVRKAVFPVAGLGTRFLPATKAMPKEMLPIVDKPLIQYAVEEAAAAGITQMIFITGRHKRSIEDHFDRAPELEAELAAKGKNDLPAAFPETARRYLRNGYYIHRPPTFEPGDRMTFSALANSLELLAREGPQAFYRGSIADAIEAEMRTHGGFLTKADLAAYAVKTHSALLGRYRNLELAFSPGATGGITALETLSILSAFPSDRVGWNSASGLHLRAEAVRYAFQDRLRYLGDPDCVDAPWGGLVSAAYGRAAADCIRPRGPRSGKATPNPWHFEAKRRRAL